MGIAKTDRDIAREDEAARLNASLRGTGIHVTAGGRAGPYAVTVDRLSKRQAERLIKVLLEATGRSPVEDACR